MEIRTQTYCDWVESSWKKQRLRRLFTTQIAHHCKRFANKGKKKTFRSRIQVYWERLSDLHDGFATMGTGVIAMISTDSNASHILNYSWPMQWQQQQKIEHAHCTESKAKLHGISVNSQIQDAQQLSVWLAMSVSDGIFALANYLWHWVDSMMAKFTQWRAPLSHIKVFPTAAAALAFIVTAVVVIYYYYSHTEQLISFKCAVRTIFNQRWHGHNWITV